MSGTLLEEDLCHSIIGAFYAVYNYYGYGLSEAVYSGAMEYELTDRGHDVVRELLVPISYKGRFVKWQRINMVVDRKVLIENKARGRLPKSDLDQVRSYLRATVFEEGLLLHFGPEPRFFRYIDSPKSEFVRSISGKS